MCQCLGQRDLHDSFQFPEAMHVVSESIVVDDAPVFQLEYRGIVNYYRLAYNVHRFRELKRVMEISLTKTLAHKYKVSVPTVYEKYGTTLKVQDREYKGLQV